MISISKLQAAVPKAVGKDPLLLGDLIARAVAFVQTQTRRYFGPVQEATEWVPGSNSRHLYLSDVAIPNDDGALVLIEERAYPGGSPTEIEASGYVVRHGDHISYLVRAGNGAKWTAGLEYAVTYERGYDTDAGPADIEALIIELVAHKLKFTGKEGMRSESISGYSFTRFGDDDLDAINGAKSTLSAWKRPVFA